MSLQKIISMTSRLFFLGAFVSFGLALIERVANAMGYTILDQKTSTIHLMDAAVVLLVFVIAIQLREMKEELKSRKP